MPHRQVATRSTGGTLAAVARGWHGSGRRRRFLRDEVAGVHASPPRRPPTSSRAERSALRRVALRERPTRSTDQQRTGDAAAAGQVEAVVLAVIVAAARYSSQIACAWLASASAGRTPPARAGTRGRRAPGASASSTMRRGRGEDALRQRLGWASSDHGQKPSAKPHRRAARRVGRHDIERSDAADVAGMVERQAIRDAAAAVVPATEKSRTPRRAIIRTMSWAMRALRVRRVSRLPTVGSRCGRNARR